MMTTKKTFFLGLSIALLSVSGFAQNGGLHARIDVSQPTVYFLTPFGSDLGKTKNLRFNIDQRLGHNSWKQTSHNSDKSTLDQGMYQSHSLLLSPKVEMPLRSSLLNSDYYSPDIHVSLEETEPFLKNRRNLYSSMWAFASLNYLYADLVGIMDKNKLVQYQTGVVEGIKITPEFLTVAAGFMQIPIANVFLPHIIKNEKTLRWVQIASGTVMTLVQSGTLFVGKPTPYYALFSAFEIAATAYITLDAIKWKAKSNKKKLIIQ